MKFTEYNKMEAIEKGRLLTCDMIMEPYPDKRKRTIRVWLPESYDGVKRFPVLYMHDGQNLFPGLDERYKWMADQGVAELPEDVQVIIVGIDTCLETRGSELWPPYPVDEDFVFSHGNPMLANVETTGDVYAEFVVKYLKPVIDEEFQTIADAAHTGIGGSSMGGLESFYMAMRYPDVFGRCLCFSPAFRCHKLSFELEELDQYDYSKIRDNRFFLYNGYETVDYTATEPTWAFFDKMHTKGMDYRHVALIFDTRQPHFEPAWGKYFPEAVSYLFSEDNSVIMPPLQDK